MVSARHSRYRLTVRRLLVFTFIASLTVFIVVQDRLTAAGTDVYVRAQRAALSGQGPPIAIADVMPAAVRHSVRVASGWSGLVAAAGLSAAAMTARRSRRG